MNDSSTSSSPLQRICAHSRRVSIRTQMLVLLLGMALFILLLIWSLSSNLLQPRYNQFIREKLTRRLDQMVTPMDTALENGVKLFRWDFTQSKPVANPAFWDEINRSFTEGPLTLANCCVDIANASLTGVMGSENLYPCLLHGNGANAFGHSASSSDRDNSLVIRLRDLCFAEGELYYIIETSSGSRQMVVGRTTKDKQYCVLISTSMTQVNEATTVLGLLLPGIAFLLILPTLAVAWLFSRHVTRPLTQMSNAANQIAGGNYNVRIDVSDARQDEFGQLCRDFNHMADQVKLSAQLQRDILANVSHDLRTPLTLIKGYAETVRDLTGNDRERRDGQLNIIIHESDRLTALVNSVLELSKVSSGAEKCEMVRFSLRQLCEEVADRYTAMCDQNQWQLQLELPDEDELEVIADPAMLERVLHNLLGNATHHLGDDGVFCLRAHRTETGVRVEVGDHGPGVPADELPYLFDRYYRSRSSAGKQGTGLGLSITKAILQQHQARFGVESTLGEGSTFWFELKAAPSVSAKLPKLPKASKHNNREKENS